MAIMKALFAASVLASLVSAIPMPGLPVEKRAEVTSTYTHTTWTTVKVTTTIYYDGDVPPTSTPEVPAATPAEPTPTPEVAAPAPPAPEVASSPSPSPSPVVSAGNFAEAPTPSPAAPESTVNVQPKAATGGPCEGSSNKCTGDVTYYNGGGGYGACGSIIDDNANTIALPVGLMGSQSNGNPYCGRSVTIIGTDGSPHTATVTDKCMGCVGNSIDLTPVLFKAVAPAGDGRVSGISWYFN